MPDSDPNSHFESEIRASMAAPQPRPEFVKDLQVRLSRQAAAVPQKNPRPFFMRWAVLAPAALLLVLAASVLVVGPQRVWAAFSGLFGYVPDIGLVRNDGSLRLLAAPVEQTRGEITLRVTQGAADGLRTVIIYQADGLSIAAANSQGEIAATGGPAALLLPDGSILAEQEAGGPGWGTGYQSRLVFPALPANVDKATLLVSRLQSMPAGAAPEDWRLALQFKPAPPDQQMMPVYELSTPTGAAVVQAAPQATSTGPAAASSPAVALGNTVERLGVRFSLDRVVDQGQGYLLEGSTTWDTSRYTTVGFDPFVMDAYVLLDATGQRIPYEVAQPDNGGSNRQGFTWALRTNSKAYPGPWILTLPTPLAYQQPAGERPGFQVDFGNSPQVGQTWQVGQQVEAFGYNVRLDSAALRQDARSGSAVVEFHLTVDSGVTGVGLEDLQNQPEAGASQAGAGGGGGGGGLEPTPVPNTITTSIPYYKTPSGLHRIELQSLAYALSGTWQVSWTPPVIAGQAVPTQPAPACLTYQKWEELKGGAAAQLPPSLTGRLLLENYTGQLMPQLSMANVDGSGLKVLAIGGWSALSPDGSKVLFIKSNGPSLFVQDVQTGEISAIPGSGADDYHGMWSPDGQWIAFVRSLSGIYIMHPDGSGLKQVTNSSTLSYLVGWLPDNRSLVITTQGLGGSQVQVVDTQSGAVDKKFTIENAKGAFARLSPDGKRLAFSEMAFGLPSYGIYVSNLDGTDKRLVAGLEKGAASAGAWSPDSVWLALSVAEPNGPDGNESLLAVRPDTCQLVRLPGLTGLVTDWK